MIIPTFTLYVEFKDGTTQNFRVSQDKLIQTVDMFISNEAKTVNVARDPKLFDKYPTQIVPPDKEEECSCDAQQFGAHSSSCVKYSKPPWTRS